MEEKTIQYWVEKLNLQPHPEGGYYKETYRSAEKVDTPRGTRSASTAIYFLLGEENFSAFHKIQSDELWHFHAGDTLEVYEIEANGNMKIHEVGEDSFQTCIKAGNWFASRPKEEGKYSLVSCTVAPGFDFEDFEMAERQSLIEEFPQHATIISQLTR